MQFGVLKFRETYMERIWGGDKLRHMPGKTLSAGAPVGEAWLVSDHPACESVVSTGALAGKSLRALMDMDAEGLLGARAHPTCHGRFPLLLKLIDAGDVLSVQVHPDDAQAAALGESDRGKTEMWHIMDADPGSELVSGLQEAVDREGFAEAVRTGDAAALLRSFPVSAGDSVFVAAGAVHAIGAGILLAEIQQNSDITYRIFDWNRVDKQGAPRTLHVEKALSVMDFDACCGGRVAPLRYTEDGVAREVLCACSYFAAEKLRVTGRVEFVGTGRSFRILLALDAAVSVFSEESGCVLERGEAALIPGNAGAWRLEGSGTLLDYYVPDMERDVIAPLRRHGYSAQQISALAGR